MNLPHPIPRSIRRGIATLVWVVVAALPCAADPAAVAPPANANDATARAEMLYNIAKFIQWPGRSFTDAEGQFVFAILGEDPLAEALAATLSDKSIAGRPVFVKFVRRIKDLDGSQIAYIAESEKARLTETLQALRGRSVLTVANVPDFIAQGGMVDFSQDVDRIRFEIHRERAEKVGLKISSKLLAIAHIVEED